MSLRGWMLFAAMGVIWGIPYLLIKVAVDEVPVPVLVFARSAVGALLLLPLALSRETRRTIARHWKPVVAFTLVELVAAWLLLADAERELTSSLTGLLIAATPIIAAFLDRFTGGEHRLDMVQMTGLAIGLAGVAVLAGHGIGGGSAWPVMEVLLVAACYATGPLIAARYLADVPGPALTAATLGLAALLCLPPAVTASTGMDALTHAIECYCSKKGNPFSDLYALEAIRLIARSIRRAVADGQDVAAREDMLMGAYWGGVCIATSSTTAVHALAYPLGGKYRIAHGLSNAVLLPSVMAFNQGAARARFADMARAMALPVQGLGEEAAADAFVQALRQLNADLGIPATLGPLGIEARDIPGLVEGAAKVTRLLDNNPRVMSRADMHALYTALL